MHIMRPTDSEAQQNAACNSHQDAPSPAGSCQADADEEGCQAPSPSTSEDHGHPPQAQLSQQAHNAQKAAKPPPSKRKRRALLPDLDADGTLDEHASGAEPKDEAPQEEDAAKAGPAARAKKRHIVQSEDDSSIAGGAATANAAGHDSDDVASSGQADRAQVLSRNQRRARLSEPGSDRTFQEGDDMDVGMGPAARAKLRHQDLPQNGSDSHPEANSAGHAGKGGAAGDDSDATAGSEHSDRPPQQADDHQSLSRTGTDARETEAAADEWVVHEQHSDDDGDDDDDPFAAMMREVTGNGLAKDKSGPATDVPSPKVQVSGRPAQEPNILRAEPAKVSNLPQNLTAEAASPAGYETSGRGAQQKDRPQHSTAEVVPQQPASSQPGTQRALPPDTVPDEPAMSSQPTQKLSLRDRLRVLRESRGSK